MQQKHMSGIKKQVEVMFHLCVCGTSQKLKPSTSVTSSVLGFNKF